MSKAKPKPSPKVGQPLKSMVSTTSDERIESLRETVEDLRLQIKNLKEKKINKVFGG